MNFYTHSGLFHADEVTAYAILELAEVCSNVVRVKSLDNIPTDGIIGDIGREYDHNKLIYDHHQGMIYRGDGYYFATAGLIWKHYGAIVINRIMPSSSYKDKVWAIVDEMIIKGIDAHDSDASYTHRANCSMGEVNVYTLSNIISSFNSDDITDHEEQLMCFTNAASFIKRLIVSEVLKFNDNEKSKEDFERLHEKYSNEVIILKKQCAWKEIVHERYPSVLYIIAPSSHPGSPFCLLATPVHPTSRQLKKQIEKPTWFNGFLHNGKFIAGSDSINELIKLAEYNVNR